MAPFAGFIGRVFFASRARLFGGERRTSSPAGRSHSRSEAAEVAEQGSSPLDSPVPALRQLEILAGHREARTRDPVAPHWVPSVLALEVPTQEARTTQHYE